MTTLQNCLNYLRSTGVRFAYTTLSAADRVESAEISSNCFTKTVVFRDVDGFEMAMVTSDSHIDLEQLRTLIGVADLYVADERALSSLFPNTEVRAMPPLGGLFNLPVYVDRKVARREFIAFHAGTERDVIHMRMDDFCSIVRPVLGDFCRIDEQIASAHAQSA